MRNLVIGISGKQGSGKTTLARGLEDSLGDRGGDTGAPVDVHRIRFAAPLYDMQEAIRKVLEGYGCHKMAKKDGRILQLLGTDWGRATLGQNVWCDMIEWKVQELCRPADFRQVVIIDDIRFENEFDMLRRLKDGSANADIFLIRLQAGENTRRVRAESWREATDHPSETSLDHRIADFDLRLNTSAETMDAGETLRAALKCLCPDWSL